MVTADTHKRVWSTYLTGEVFPPLFQWFLEQWHELICLPLAIFGANLFHFGRFINVTLTQSSESLLFTGRLRLSLECREMERETTTVIERARPIKIEID